MAASSSETIGEPFSLPLECFASEMLTSCSHRIQFDGMQEATAYFGDYSAARLS